MKKCLLICSIFFTTSFSTVAPAADLMEVYRQALVSDQTFQQAISQQLSDKQIVPINLSALLPALSGYVNPAITKTSVSGPLNFTGPNTQKTYGINLTLSQTVFNLAQTEGLLQAFSLSKQADATVNAAAQDLMLRVAKAYFDILQAEDNVRYEQANKEAYAKQLDQVTQQFNVGLKTITDVYTARASYDTSTANLIAAQNTLSNARENLRVITGIYYPHISKLSESYPFSTPMPADIEAWVRVAQQQNWSIKAAQYAADAARTNIKTQFAGHIPNLQLQGSYNINFTRTLADQPTTQAVATDGAGKTRALSGGLMLNIPIMQGGLVSANTRKAQYDYRAAFQQLDLQVRTTINTARQSYLGVIAGMSQIKADKQAIKSSTSSLQGMRAGYQVGTQTLVDVLTVQQKVFQAYEQYSQDRYAYINSLLALKNAAGTLSVKDLQAINTWLVATSNFAFYHEKNLDINIDEGFENTINTTPTTKNPDKIDKTLDPLNTSWIIQKHKHVTTSEVKKNKTEKLTSAAKATPQRKTEKLSSTTKLSPQPKQKTEKLIALKVKPQNQQKIEKLSSNIKIPPLTKQQIIAIDNAGHVHVKTSPPIHVAQAHKPLNVAHAKTKPNTPLNLAHTKTHTTNAPIKIAHANTSKNKSDLS